ncbi:MAG: SIMPL domain-containing protein [Longimicrobiales bacterium]|nr:SIMPL domain-containing protein [Longimicrobiales bacterium]
MTGQMIRTMRAGERRGRLRRALAGAAPALAFALAPAPILAATPLPTPSSGGAWSSTSAGAERDTATVVVSASASTSVTPDRARLRLAVETEANSARVSTERNAETTTGVIAALRAALGAAAEIETAGFAVHAIRSNDTGRRVVGYRTVNSVVVTLSDLEMVGRAVDEAVGAGANRVSSLDFFAADTREAYLDALARAVERARTEARVMARAAGGELGRVISIESTGRGGAEVRPMAMGTLARADTPIEVGDLEVTASVRLEIQLRSP